MGTVEELCFCDEEEVPLEEIAQGQHLRIWLLHQMEFS